MPLTIFHSVSCLLTFKKNVITSYISYNVHWVLSAALQVPNQEAIHHNMERNSVIVLFLSGRMAEAPFKTMMWCLVFGTERKIMVLTREKPLVNKNK